MMILSSGRSRPRATPGRSRRTCSTCLFWLLVLLVTISGCKSFRSTGGFVGGGPVPDGPGSPPRNPEASDPVETAGFQIRLPMVGEIVIPPEHSRHCGLTIRARSGTVVVAASRGRISHITASYPGLGPAVVLSHPGGFRSIVGPVRVLEGLTENDLVDAGERLGCLESLSGEAWACLRFRVLKEDQDVPCILDYLPLHQRFSGNRGIGSPESDGSGQ